MEIQEHEIEEIVVLEIEGNIIGPPTSSILSTKLNELVKIGKNKIILDLAKVDWINSTGIGIITKALHLIRNNQGDLKLARPLYKVKNILQITNFIKIIDIFDTIDKAIIQFKLEFKA
jgi:anti-sigma B factor antagonist